MDMPTFYTEARKRIQSQLPLEHDVTTMSSGDKFGGFRVRKKATLTTKAVIEVPVTLKDEKIVFEVKPLDPKYAELALNIGKKLSEIT